MANNNSKLSIITNIQIYILILILIIILIILVTIIFTVDQLLVQMRKLKRLS
jgi:hypothetical protein